MAIAIPVDKSGRLGLAFVAERAQQEGTRIVESFPAAQVGPQIGRGRPPGRTIEWRRIG
ncbi:hypothetical protein [Rhizobium lusitanum]|uniref:hypothetical protein n=1 Tax=Rhizobium lusitanum TaxID=293958 RepID=UPI002573DCA5|nr:hypothetical protein [Rhizobium lusitanum]